MSAGPETGPGHEELDTALEEAERMAALRATELLDSAREESFDRLTRLAARVLRTPVSLITLVDVDRQFFKSAYGLPEPWASRRETPLFMSFCQHAMRADGVLQVSDARRNARFSHNEAISGLDVIAYLGVPLQLADGKAIGAFCVIDSRVRRWTDDQVRVIRELAALVESEIELRLRMRETARLRSEAQENALRLRLLLESTGEGIYGVDQAGLCTFSNRAAAAMLGYTSDELVGLHMHSTIHHSREDGSPYPVEDCRVYQAFRTGRSTSVDDEVLWRKDGTGFAAEYFAYPLRRNGELDGAVVTFRDITDRKRREAQLAHYTRQLEESDRRKDEFLAVLGHELRNPLAAIATTAELLASAPHGHQSSVAAGLAIAEQMDMLTALLDDLLDVGRITRGKVRLKRELVGLQGLLNRAVSTARSAVDAGHHQVSLEVAPDLYADLDPVRMEQVLVNLLSNAAKYTDPGGRIRLRAWAVGADLHVTVTDNGRGIEPALQAAVFEPFRQAHADLAGPGGLGIGLTLVKRLVELHGGRVKLRSAGVGQGCEVRIALPALVRPAPAPSPTPAARTAAEQSSAGDPAGRTVVLVVDDNQSAADGLVKLLDRVGYRAEAVYCGLDAVTRVARGGVDAALVDIGLPDISGYEVAKRLRSDQRLRDLLLIALSGFGHAEAQRTARAAGFDLHLAKPARLDVLRTALQTRPAGARHGAADPTSP